MQRKRLYFDLETAPNIGFFWSAGHKLNIGYENIIKERAIICVCYKWEGDKKVHSLTWDKNPSDKKLLQDFIKVANEADELVGHNGDAFDLPWIRTRCLYHQIDLFPNYTTIDTLKLARNKFRFNSNRLDYIGELLRCGRKIHTEPGLWLRVLRGDKKAIQEMVKYNKQDVLLLEKVYNKLKVWVPSSLNRNLFKDTDMCCPHCGGANTHRRGTITTKTKVWQRYLCNDCGGWAKKTLNSIAR